MSVSDHKPTQSPSQSPSQASIAVGLRPGGTLFLETWQNGQRRVIDLPEGGELFEIRAALFERASALRAKRQREAEAAQSAAQERHRRVWDYAALRHGVGFANKTIGERSSHKAGTSANAPSVKKPGTSPSVNTLAKTAIVPSLDLL